MSFSDDELSQIRANMTEGGIPADVQESLIAKLQSGAILDSSTNAAPTDSFTDIAPDGADRSVNVYADGSRRWCESAAPTSSQDAGGMQALDAGISDCTDAAGVGSFWHRGCRIASNDPISTAGFIVDYKTTDVTNSTATPYSTPN